MLRLVVAQCKYASAGNPENVACNWADSMDETALDPKMSEIECYLLHILHILVSFV